jgi:hypothetical protein
MDQLIIQALMKNSACPLIVPENNFRSPYNNLCHMQSCVRKALTNIRGGIVGVLIYLVITALVFFIAFMAAFGNDTPLSRIILEVAALWFLIAYPLWTIPISYFLGGYLLFREPKNCNPED